jgi:putative phosphoribosyl transferase
MDNVQRFHDRREAGQLLARRLEAGYKDRDDLIVLGLPRGGVPIAYEIARGLRAPLDVFVVRKLGVPWRPELAMGAIAGNGIEVLNGGVITAYNIPPHVIRVIAEREGIELQRQLLAYRGQRALPDLRGRTAILVDDGLATGSTMRAAVNAVRQQQPRAIVVAAPVAAPRTCLAFQSKVDDIVCLHTPSDFAAVGDWYDDFSQTSDDEVRELLSDDSTRRDSDNAHAAHRS